MHGRKFLVWVLVVTPAVWAEQNKVDLGSLYDSHRWFELRNVVAGTGASSFYKGAVECAFNNLPRCEKLLYRVLKYHPGKKEAVEAHRLLLSVYFREGKYNRALKEADELLALDPDDADSKDDLPLLRALSGFSDQIVITRAQSVLNLETDGLPVVINGANATYWFDTGANLSVMSESEAKRFGLSIHAVESTVHVMSGAEVAFRIALAENLQIGGFRLKNVAFLVFSDDQQPFNTLPQKSRGLIGIPVLLTFGRFSITQDRHFEISSGRPNLRTADANLCFDGKNPAALVKYKGRPLAFTLDTGASMTDLYPPFAAAFPELIANRKRESYQMRGVGSTEQFDSVLLPSVEFTIDNFVVALHPATVLLKENGESSKFFYGNLGFDLLRQPARTTFDFTKMRLSTQ